MTEQELWLANARAIHRRLLKHLDLASLAQQEYNTAVAYARDSALSPLEAAYAGIALEEVRSKANKGS